jgi:hypothetical protein
MTLESFAAVMKNRLSKMREQPKPLDLAWPEGCYGSAQSILLFVGPSPGGTVSSGHQAGERDPSGGYALWDEPFSEPYDTPPTGWGRKYVYSIPSYIRTILGLHLDDAARLYGFANFDWVQSPTETRVSAERMTSGEKHVLHVLSSCDPRLVVPLTREASRRFRQLLSGSYKLIPPRECRAFIRVSARAYHRELEVYRLEGEGALNGCVVIRSPQHPNRVLNRDHAERCARAIRQAFEQVLAGDTVTICEDGPPPKAESIGVGS